MIAAEGAPPQIVELAEPAVGDRLIRFTFTCQRCASILEASSNLVRKSGRCPTCGAVFTIPEVDFRTGLATGPAVVKDDGQLPTPMHAYATAGQKAPKIVRLPNGEQVIVCPRCTKNLPVDADTCPSCGIPFTMEGAASMAAAGPSRDNSMAGLSLTLGILSLLLFCLPILGPIAIGFGIGGFRRSQKLPNQQGRGMAIGGIACGIVSLGIFGWFITR